MNQIKKERGVTLIALVVTIVILIILAGVSISMIVGDNGILSGARSVAKRTEEMQVNSQIYMNELQKELETKIAGDKEKPTLELSLDQTQTGVEKVVITAEAKIIEGSIKEIEKPNGEKQQGNSTTYEVNQNGEYTFKVSSDKGKTTTKTIHVMNIKSEGIDLTGLVTGENPGHEHVYVSSFDDTSHYEACMICGLKRNVVNHTITRKMAIENAAVCSATNYYIDSCSCGYYKQGKIEHTSDNQWHTTVGTMHHYTLCSVCTDWPKNEPCVTADGQRIDCNHLGTCSICGYTYTEKNHCNTNTEGKCSACGEQLLDVLEFSYQYDAQNDEYTFTYRFKILDDNIKIKDNSVWVWGDGTSATGLKSISKTHLTENGIQTVRIVVKPTPKYQNKYLFRGRIQFTYGSNNQEFNIIFDKSIIPITAQSSIDEVTIRDIEEIQGWTKQKQITVKGTDNWSNQVKLSMQDEEGKVVYQEVVVPVQNGNYTYTFIPEIEADNQGKKYKIIVKDVFDQSKEKEVTIYNIDFKAPELTSQTEYTEEWSRTKNITVEATDEGSGNVQIAFNNEADYQLGEEKEGKYIRNYIFTGEIYTPVQGAIYLKDALGNYQMTTIQIGKIDNTSPTITNVRTEKTETGTTVIIEANDFNEEIGQEGSGIAGYSITTSKELPTDIEYKSHNEIEVEKAGTYYIYVKDNTGNISARYTLLIQE